MNLTNDSSLLNVLDILDFVQYKVSIGICISGIVGNILAITVCAINYRLRTTTCGAYLLSLSLYDTVYLMCQLSYDLHINGLINFPDRFTCGLLVFLLHSSSCLSPLCVCAFTIERFVVVRYPFRRATVCTLSKVRKILLLMLPYPIIIFTILATVEESNGYTCDLRNDETSLMINAIVQIIDILISCLIPMIVIFSLNALIAKDLLSARKQHMALIQNRRSIERRNQSEVNRNKETNITAMLFIVSTTFVLLNLPSYIVRIKVQYVLVVARDHSVWTVYDEIAEKISTVLYVINFAIDFLLYNASSANFRSATRDVIRSILWRKIRRNRSSIWRSTGSGRTTQTDMNETGSIRTDSVKREMNVTEDKV